MTRTMQMQEEKFGRFGALPPVPSSALSIRLFYMRAMFYTWRREGERASTNYRPHRRMHGKELEEEEEEEEEAGLMKVAIHTQSRFARCSDIPTSKQFT